ncbi:hypothetical protein ACO0LC_19705 [Undibacterium sp. JH2W]|uniref:hypothetical protein n=1 Tax=Undibacterium sp. JH2W TaxID=3413037 RepID=UPI003BF18A18
MKNLMKCVAGMLVIASLPAFADVDMKWRAEVTDRNEKTPIAGVKISFDLFDVYSKKTTHNSCISDATGACEVSARMTNGLFEGGQMEAREITFTKEKYTPDPDIKWFNQGPNKIFRMTMTADNWQEEQRQKKLKQDEDLALTIQKVGQEKDEQLQLSQKIARAEESSKITCQSKTECDKLFSLTEIYIVKTSDMKIQMATATTIETYNPTEDFKLGFTAMKMPGKGNSSIVTIKAICKEAELSTSEPYWITLQKNTACYRKRLSATEGFQPFISGNLKN